MSSAVGVRVDTVPSSSQRQAIAAVMAGVHVVTRIARSIHGTDCMHDNSLTVMDDAS
jgi:hypothetical protein